MNQKIISKAICVAASFMMVPPVVSYAKTSAKATVKVKKSANKTVKTSTKNQLRKK